MLTLKVSLNLTGTHLDIIKNKYLLLQKNDVLKSEDIKGAN